ncbi:MAG: hypothetical protein GEV07_04095 [Streptosporangiales bacterium]|nr:hypothetical protein [Streptosporangiales bacterium]
MTSPDDRRVEVPLEEETDVPQDESDALVTDELLPEERLTEFEPPDEPSTPTASGHTGADERTDEPIDERLDQEQHST